MNINGFVRLYEGEFKHLHTDLRTGKELKKIAHEHPRLYREVKENLNLLAEAYAFYLQTKG